MRFLIITAFATAALASTTGAALAQYGDAVPIQRGYCGQAVCPSNYVVRGGACVSIYAGRGYDDGRQYRREQRYRDYDGGGRGIQPQVNYRGELQCPSNYVIRGGVCVSLY